MSSGPMGWSQWVASRTRAGVRTLVGRTTRMTLNALTSISRVAYESYTGQRLEAVVTGLLERFLDVEIKLSNSGPSEPRPAGPASQGGS